MNGAERDREGPQIRIRRILVALDASPGSTEALERAVEMAALWKAELSGLFVEDIDLLRLAAAASATRFVYPTASEEPLSMLAMESELRALAERAKRELGQAAARASVSWSFRTVRGRLPAEILLAAAQADLLSLGGAGWSLARAAGGRARSSAATAGRGVWAALPVLVVYDGPQSDEACRFAAQLAETCGNRLTVLFPSPSARLDPAAQAAVLRLLSGQRLKVRLRAIDSADIPGLLRAVRSEEGEMLVMSGRSALFEERTVGALMRETEKALLVVGRRPGADHEAATTTKPPEKF